MDRIPVGEGRMGPVTRQLVIAGIGFRATYGEWPAADAWVFLSLAYGVVALPAGLAQTLVEAGIAIAAIPLAVLFWPLVLGLQITAVYRRRWIVFLPVALLLGPAAWNWTVHAVAMLGI